MKKELDVIATSIDDIKQINKSKATRIELVWKLEVGGLSPTILTVEQALNLTDKPIHVMIRPHYQGFVYSEGEFAEVRSYIKKLLALPKRPKGIVFGSLNNDNTINEEQLKEIIEKKEDLELTFHRAFDETNDYKKALNTLKKYKIDTLLSSGTKPKASEGIEQLKYLKKHLGEINLLVGSGVSINNAKEISKSVGSHSLHVGSAIRIDNSLDKEISAHKIDEIYFEL